MSEEAAEPAEGSVTSFESDIKINGVGPNIDSIKEYFDKYEREELEVAKDQMSPTNYPEKGGSPKEGEFLEKCKRWRLVHTTFEHSIEESYFWILNYMRHDPGFVHVIKVTDIFSTSEMSSFEGVREQRVGLQQDKVMGFLATIGKMIKDLFQLVRELRILEERLGYHKQVEDPDIKIAEPAEITLKGLFIDVAQGGGKNPASVYGMARELQFTTLPDLFFAIHPKTKEDVGPVVDKLGFNKKVKEVLKRNLYSYIRWREETERELSSRWIFTLDYLEQHYEVIRTYIQWVKPYMRTINRLQASEDKLSTPDLVTAFEGSMIEIELLGRKYPEKNKKIRAVLIVHFDYRTRPEMNYMAEGYQKGPLHVGELEMTFRCYGMSDRDVANYLRMRELEDMEMMMNIDRSLKAAMDALGDDLQRYLKEARKRQKGRSKIKQEAPKEEKEEAKPSSMLEPFSALWGNIGGLFGRKKKAPPNPASLDGVDVETEMKNAHKDAKTNSWITYKNYKSAHKMMTW